MSDWLLQDHMELVNLATGATISLSTAEVYSATIGQMVSDEGEHDVELRTPGLVQTLLTAPHEEAENHFFDLVVNLEANILPIKDSLTVQWWQEQLEKRGLT